MLFSLKILSHKERHLALVQWYDFKYNNPYKLFKYDCPYMKIIQIFTIIIVDSIVEPVHIISRFSKSNEYFVNVFMF